MSTKAVYDYLVSSNEQVPDYATFAQKMKAPEYVEAVRTYMQSAGEAVPDSSTFYSKYANTSDDLRQQAKDQYAQDVASQKDAERASIATESPNLYAISNALFPRSTQNAVQKDRGVIGQAYDAAADVSSMLGRALAYVAGGNNEIDEEAREKHPYLSKAADIAQGIVTDPLLLPSLPVGGAIGKAITSSALPLAAKIASGIGTGAGMNALAGIISRGADRSEAVRAFDPKDIGTDALIGAGFGVGGEALAGTGRWLKSRGQQGIGDAIIQATPLSGREDVIRKWSMPASEANIPTQLDFTGDASTSRGWRFYDPVEEKAITAPDRTSAAKNIGAYLTEGQGEIKPTQLSLTNEEINARNLAAKYSEKASESKKLLDKTYDDLESRYETAKEAHKSGQDVETPLGYVGPFGNVPYSKAAVFTEGVPVQDFIDDAIKEMSIARGRGKSYNMGAIADFVSDLNRDRLQGATYEGMLSPKTARDLKSVLYDAIQDSKKASQKDLNEFIHKLYSKINTHLNGLTVLERNLDPATGKTQYGIGGQHDLASAEALGTKIPPTALDPTTMKAQNAQAERNLLLAEGIGRSKYFNDAFEPSAFGHTMGIIRAGTSLANPAVLAAEVPRFSGKGRGIAIGKVAETAGRAAPTIAALQNLQTRRDLSETEYRNIQTILNVPTKQRTTQQAQYLSKYGY